MEAEEGCDLQKKKKKKKKKESHFSNIHFMEEEDHVMEPEEVCDFIDVQLQEEEEEEEERILFQ